MKAEERHKLKTNQLAVYIQQAQEWVKAHSRLLIGIGVVVVLGVVLTAIFLWRSGAQQVSAWNDLAKPEEKYMGDAGEFRPNADLSAAADQFARVAKDYPSNEPVTTIALYDEAAALAEQFHHGSLDKGKLAEKVFTDVVARPHHPLVTPLAYLGLADLALSAREVDFKKARDLLGKVADDTKADPAMKDIAQHLRQEIGQPEQLNYGVTAEVSIPPEMMPARPASRNEK